jgi:hypothetical protein
VLFQHEFVLFQHEFSCHCIENLSTRIFFNTLAISNTGILSVREFRFWDLAQWPTAIIKPKSQNSNIGHDGILSIRNFMLMINNNFSLFSCPVTCQEPIKCAPDFRSNTQFLICVRTTLLLQALLCLWPGISLYTVTFFSPKHRKKLPDSAQPNKP